MSGYRFHPEADADLDAIWESKRLSPFPIRATVAPI